MLKTLNTLAPAAIFNFGFGLFLVILFYFSASSGDVQLLALPVAVAQVEDSVPSHTSPYLVLVLLPHKSPSDQRPLAESALL